MTGPVGAGQTEHERSRVRVLGHLLNGQGQPEDACARTSEFDRDAQAEQPGVAKRLEDIGRVGALFVDGPCPWLDLVLSQAPDRVAESRSSSGSSKSTGEGYRTSRPGTF